MATNEILIAAPPQEVFDLLLDPRHCSYWVVGARAVESVDERWPERGASFRVKVGVGPLTLPGESTLIDVQRPERLTLRARVVPLGSALVTLSLRPARAGTRLTLQEEPEAKAAILPRPLADLLLGARNAEALRRLRALAEEHGGVRTSSPRTNLSGMPVLEQPEVSALLASSRRAYLCVKTESGPHVTPQLFSSWGGRLWFVTPADALEARVARHSPSIGVLVGRGGRWLVAQGQAVVLDALHPGELLGGLPETALVGPALLSYASRHPAEVASWALRVPAEALEAGLAARRVLVAVRPRGALLVEGDSVWRTYGRWPRSGHVGARGRTPPARSVRAPELPDEPTDVADRGGSAVLGWLGVSGPLALPVQWDASKTRATLPVELARAAGAGRHSRACVTLDEETGTGPTGSGVIFRGAGELVSTGRLAHASLQAQRAYWRGRETGTVGASTRGRAGA